MRAMDCKPEVYEDYTRRLIAELETLVWSHPAADSWYRNRAGRVVTTSPWRRGGLLALDARAGSDRLHPHKVNATR
mgnify:CR=1 FL=1